MIAAILCVSTLDGVITGMSFSSSPERMWGPPVSTQWAWEGALFTREKQPENEADHLHPVLKLKREEIPLLQLHA
jgi:hypothetical protein